MTKINFLKFIKLCFQTVAPGCKYNNYQYIKVIADRLEAACNGKIRRIIFNMPPRSMKSICTSVAWPAWILGNQPTARIIVASYSRLLSEKHSLDTRYIMQSDWYRELFPEVKLSKEQNTKYKFLTVQRGFRIATSVGGTLTGEGGDFIIVDDPLNPAQALSKTFRRRAANWFDQTLVTRFNDRKKGVIVLIMHRLHQEDLTGHLLSKPGSIWHQICLPMLSEKEQVINSTMIKDKLYSRKINQLLYPLDKEEIKMIKVELGSYAFSAQYQQSPLPLSSGVIKQEWLKRYKNLPQDFTHVTQSWDTAISVNSSSDFSVCTTWTKIDNRFYLIDVYRAKLEYPKLKKQFLSLAERWNPHAILVEAKTSGQQLLQELKVNSNLPIIAIVPHNDKLTRLHQVISLIEAVRVFLPYHAIWLSDFECEILMFPETHHDDQVDSTVQYLQWIKKANETRIRCL